MGGVSERLGEHARLALDTAIFIYHLEQHPGYVSQTQELFSGIEGGLWTAVTSTVTLMELTVRPWQLERPEVARAYEEALTHFPNLTLVDVTRGVARRAAQLRARYRLRPADALHLATALVHDATVFVTNDRDFVRVEGIEVVVLGEGAGRRVG